MGTLEILFILLIIIIYPVQNWSIRTLPLSHQHKDNRTSAAGTPTAQPQVSVLASVWWRGRKEGRNFVTYAQSTMAVISGQNTFYQNTINIKLIYTLKLIHRQLKNESQKWVKWKQIQKAIPKIISLQWWGGFLANLNTLQCNCVWMFPDKNWGFHRGDNINWVFHRSDKCEFPSEW